MSDDVPKNVSAWVGDDTDKIELVREFDAACRLTQSGVYSRSDELWRAIELRIAVEEVFRQFDMEAYEYREKQATVKQALYNFLRDELD